ncbi:hypothetical protein [Rhodococcus marinonascens]|uniref:hypothetical protein n=1 Tax=Rhodococcus marinonascens TaxID=38311 RepID=UPI00093450A1|nr:hypothetical protein [Rhodococcus marinonascens]
MSKAHSAIRALAATALAAASVIGLTGVASAQEAQPPVLRPDVFKRGGILGDDVVHFLSRGCGGVVHTRIQDHPEEPGMATITLTSQGRAAPGCDATMKAIWVDGVFPFEHVQYLPLDGGVGPQEPVSYQVPIGAGVSLMSIGSASHIAKGVSHYIYIS